MEYEPTSTIKIWIKAQRNGIQVDMTKKPELYTKARATPIILPITKDAIDPPTTNMSGIIIKTYHFNVRDFANIMNAHIPAGKYIARENNTDQIMVNRQISCK